MRQLDRTLIIIAALVIVISVVSLAVPFTREGFPSGHDATAHITYTFLFDRALSQGQVPVRWVEWVRSGEGQPLFNFYPPGLYYLIEAVHVVVPWLSTALKSAVVLLWWCGALFTFAWLRPLGGMPAGLAAVLFVLSPYVIVDVFVRAAYPELAAIACAPGLLWSIERLMRSARLVDALLVACFVGAMLTCHLLSSLIFAPVGASYVIFCLLRAEAPWRRAGLLVAGVVIGVGMAAFYLLPSMAELPHVAIGRMTSGYSDYQQHFVAPSQWFSRAWGYGASVAGPGDNMPLHIGVVQWLVIALGITRLAVGAFTRRPVPHGAALAFWLVVVGTAMFLMTDRSALLWRVIPALSYLQFPWRYFMVISLGTAALAGVLLSSISSRTLQALLVIGAMGWQYQLHRDHLKPADYIPRRAMNIDNPRWPDMESMGVRAFIERGFTPVTAQREAPDGIGRWGVVAGDADVKDVRLADHLVDLEVTTSTGARLSIHSHAFPGWSVSVNGASTDVTIDPRHGFMEVTLPPGAHRVEARFGNTPVRTLANRISLASLGLWSIGLVWSVRFRQRAAASQD